MANRLFPALTAVLAAVFAAGSAPAQRVDPILQLQRDVVELQNTVKDLKSSMETRNQTLQALVEKAVDRVNTMGSELQSVQSGAQNNAQSNQSNIEKIARMLEETRARNDKSDRDLAAALQTLSADMAAMNNRIGGLGDKLATSLTDKTDTLGKTLNQNLTGMDLKVDALGRQVAKLLEDQNKTPLPTPEELFRSAYLDYAQGLYDLALDGFGEIVGKYPNHPVAARAEFFRGQTFYDQSKWKAAIDAYDTVLIKYKDQDTKRAALYKKGLSLANQKENNPAIEVFTKVTIDFPETLEAINAAEQIKKLTPPPPPPAPPTPPAPRGTGTPPRGGE